MVKVVISVGSTFLYYVMCRDLVVSERDGRIQELKDTISQLNLERTELITKVSIPKWLYQLICHLRVLWM